VPLDALEEERMLSIDLQLPRGRQPTILFIGAHSDDIEIGCGGTVQELLRRYPRARVHWVVLSGEDGRDREAHASARRLLKQAYRPGNVIVSNFRGSYFPAEFAALKDFFETLKPIAPDLVFSHCREELHQDHRVLGELTWNTFRNHVVLEYEIPKFDGGLGSPSVFVPLTRAMVRFKVQHLMKTFASQRSRRWFTPETFEGLMRLRGIECNAPSGYAEAFYSRKLVFGGEAPPTTPARAGRGRRR
jgi:LmbE family N-acetylglucosaminyl deacetylase